VEQSMVAVKQQIAFYASTPSYRPVLEASGWDFGPELTAMSKRGRWEEMADVITDDVVAEVGVVATIDELGSAIRERYEGRVQRVGFYNLGGVASLDEDALSQVLTDIKGS
jgi:hypothetical protein